MHEQGERKAQHLKSSKFVKPRGRQWLAAALVLICIFVSGLGSIDAKADKYIEDALTQALLAYGGARALNAGISLLQSAEFGGQFFATASVQPFQVLDPVDDMVEDYATAMKYSIGSLMIQRLLVEILSTNFLKWLTFGIGVILLACLALNASFTGPIFKGFLFVTMVRLLFVVSMLLSGMMDSAFINNETEKEINQVKQTEHMLRPYVVDSSNSNDTVADDSQIYGPSEQRTRWEVLSEARGEFNDAKADKQSAEVELKSFGIKEKLKVLRHSDEYLQAKNDFDEASSVYRDKMDALAILEKNNEKLEASPDKEKSLLSKLKSRASLLKDHENIEDLLEVLKQKMKDVIESMLKLTALFIFKTLIMPLGFLLILLKGFKTIWGFDILLFLNANRGQL